MRILSVLALGVLGCAGPALAQIERLPETSRSEAQTNAISRSLDSQAQSRAASQQNQFEINSLRTENAIRSAPSVTTPPVVVGPGR